MSTTPKSNRTTHTPGPWRIDDIWIEAGADTIAEVWNDGNASLIAAAPELLGVLRELLSSQNRNDKAWSGVIEKAIAKAEGR